MLAEWPVSTVRVSENILTLVTPPVISRTTYYACCISLIDRIRGSVRLFFWVCHFSTSMTLICCRPLVNHSDRHIDVHVHTIKSLDCCCNTNTQPREGLSVNQNNGSPLVVALFGTVLYR